MCARDHLPHAQMPTIRQPALYPCVSRKQPLKLHKAKNITLQELKRTRSISSVGAASFLSDSSSRSALSGLSLAATVLFSALMRVSSSRWSMTAIFVVFWRRQLPKLVAGFLAAGNWLCWRTKEVAVTSEMVCLFAFVADCASRRAIRGLVVHSIL